jgi:hypothetical protein
MTLQEAIRIIAEYDGWKSKYRGLQLVFTKDGYMRFEDEIKYSTSADALLPVYRKVRANYFVLDDTIGSYILDGMYEQACIELAGFIQQMSS